jgi:glycosyltransferase involved in cell wall biosynthesis
LLARRVSTNKPAILCTSHGGDLYGLNDPISKSIKRYVIKNVDALTVVSRAMQDEVLILVPDTKLPVVAPMGTDLHNLFTPDNSVKRSACQLLFVGRLVEKKGLKYLLKALPEIIKKFPNTRLNIAGSGPEQVALELQTRKLSLEGHVNFLGRLSHTDLVNQYRQATMAVFPFVQAKDGDIEGLGLVMIEAMGCGCPVVASDIPAVHDVLIDGVTGLLTPSRNIKKLVKNINELLSSPDKRQVIATKGREQVLNKFSWEASVKQYQSLLKKIIPNEFGG